MDPALAAVLAAAASAGALGLAGYAVFGQDRTAADKLAAFTGVERREVVTRNLGGIARTAARLSATTDKDQLSALRKWLSQGGFRERNAVELYSASRTGAAIVGALLIFLLLPKSSVAWMAFSSLLGATIGYYAPYLYVQNRVQKRRTDLLRSFPDAMDLLVSTVEAGLGLDSAFRRVAEELETAAPDLARELQMVTHEVNSGVPRLEALRHLDDRTGVDEIGALVNVLVQADRFGTSVARALRVHGEHTRTKRMQRAEQAAAKVSPKLTVLMILFILPCLVIVLIGPAIVQVKNIVLPAAGDRGLAP